MCLFLSLLYIIYLYIIYIYFSSFKRADYSVHLDNRWPSSSSSSSCIIFLLNVSHVVDTHTYLHVLKNIIISQCAYKFINNCILNVHITHSIVGHSWMPSSQTNCEKPENHNHIRFFSVWWRYMTSGTLYIWKCTCKCTKIIYCMYIMWLRMYGTYMNTKAFQNTHIHTHTYIKRWCRIDGINVYIPSTASKRNFPL